ncbi:MAG: hypothetical protein WDM78_17240 [Puia sp.]
MSDAKSRSISPENFNGDKKESGGMAEKGIGRNSCTGIGEGGGN